MRFTDVCLITEDVLRLKKFYEAVFGVIGEGDEFHSSIDLNGFIFTLDSAAMLSENNAFGYVSGKSSANVIIGFNVEKVDAEYERLKELDVETLNQPTTHPWGARSFQFKDPDGNIINFRTIAQAP